MGALHGRTCTAQPNWHQVSGYSVAPSKQGAQRGHPAFPQCMRAPHCCRSTPITPWSAHAPIDFLLPATASAASSHSDWRSALQHVMRVPQNAADHVGHGRNELRNAQEISIELQNTRCRRMHVSPRQVCSWATAETLAFTPNTCNLMASSHCLSTPLAREPLSCTLVVHTRRMNAGLRRHVPHLELDILLPGRQRGVVLDVEEHARAAVRVGKVRLLAVHEPKQAT